MMRIPARTLIAVALLSLLLAACGGGGSDKTKTVERTVPAAEPTHAVYTGDGAIDQVIGAALSGNDIELAGLAGYQKVACTKAAPAPGGPPACREAEADAAMVEILPATTACNPSWVRPEQVPDIFRAALPAGKTTLVAVARLQPIPAAFGGGFGATEVAILRTGDHADGQPAGVALHVNNGRVVWIEADCANISELLGPDRVASFILDPNGTITLTPPAAVGTPVQ